MKVITNFYSRNGKYIRYISFLLNSAFLYWHYPKLAENWFFQKMAIIPEPRDTEKWLTPINKAIKSFYSNNGKQFICHILLLLKQVQSFLLQIAPLTVRISKKKLSNFQKIFAKYL